MISISITVCSIIVLTVNTSGILFSLNRKYPVWKIITVFLLFLVVLLSLNYIIPDFIRGFQRVAPGLFFLIPIFFMFEGNVWQKIFIFYFSLMVSSTIFCLLSMFTELFFPFDSMPYAIMVITLAVFVYTGYFMLLFRYAKIFFQKLFMYAERNIGYFYMLIPISSYYIMRTFFMSPTGFPKEIQPTASSLFLILFLLGSLLMMCAFIISSNERSAAYYELELSKEILSAGTGYYEKILALSQYIRIMKHDYKYQVNLLNSLYTENKQEELAEYLTVIHAQIEELAIPSFCENQVVNALISSYYEQCQQKNITFFHHVLLPDRISIDNYEFCILLGNLLENAVEACSKQASGEERRILLDIKPHHNQLFIQVTNSFNGIVKQKQLQLQSTKANGGLGIKSIMAVAQKHNGEYIHEWDEKEFRAYIVLQLSELDC